MSQKAQDDDLVMSLVDLALAKPPAERESFLREACSGDPDLFSQAWSYVEWDDRMQGFLKEPLFQPFSPEHPFVVGSVLDGRFRIEREIAQGGMGVVYEAWDEKLERRIAIKCAKTGFRKRLPPEVRHAREISHPNVCKIFEIHTAHTSLGEVDFVTMEYLAGETLAERIKRGPVPAAEALSVARQLCAGLAAAHSQGVIHGDLKGGNVLLTKVADGTTRAAITDFGMARARESSQATAQSGPRGGTPDYMAPELWKGEKATLASDVYALGVLLRELTTGSRKVSALSAKWSSILDKCLAEAPEDRYQSAVEVAKAFEPTHTRRWFALAAAAALVAVATGVITYQRAIAPKDVVRLAMLPFTYSPELAPVADGVLRETSANLAKLTGGTRARYSAVALAGAQRRGVATLEEARAKFDATHVLHGSLTVEKDQVVLHALLTDTRNGVNLKDWTIPYAPGQVRYVPVALAGFVTGALHLPLLAVQTTVNAAAQVDYLAGVNYVRREATVDAAVAACERAVALDPDSPLTYACLAEAQWYKYNLTKDSQRLERAQNAAQDAERRNLDLPPVHRIMGILKANSGFYELAAADFLRAIELDPASPDTYRRLGQLYERNSQFDLALPALQKAISLEPNYYRNYQDLAAFYFNRGQYQDALPHLQKMVDLEPSLSVAHYALGTDYLYLGRFPAAEDELRLSIRQEVSARALTNLALVLMYQGKDHDAIEYLLREVDLYPQRHLGWLNLGIAYRRTNVSTKSDDANRRGLKAALKEVERDPRDGLIRAAIGYFCARLGDRDRAISETEQAVQVTPNDSETQFIAVQTYEALELREASLRVLSNATTQVIANVNRWPDVADLHKDPGFLRLLAVRIAQ